MYRNNHNLQPPRPPSRLEKLELAQASTIDLILALHALLVAKGLSSHEEIDKMAGIVAKVRPKLSEAFTVEEGIKAIVAAFRIETQGGKDA